jgi:putative acetyltransferase
MSIDIGIDDPRAQDVRALLAVHLAGSRSLTPAEYSFALDVDELVDPSVTFFSVRDGGRLVGIGALKRLDRSHAELKSMHTVGADRRRGVGSALLAHLLGFARLEGYRRVSLETGSTEDFAAARSLYAQAGFEPCEPFGHYQASAYNTFMAMVLGRDEEAEPA